MKKGNKGGGLSNALLLGVLGLLCVVIVGLGVGIGLTSILKRNGVIDQTGNEEPSPTGNYEIARQACEVIGRGAGGEYSEDFDDAVVNFETVGDDSDVYMNQDFRSCYIGLSAYYSLENNAERAAYYNDLVSKMVTEEESKQMDERADYFLQNNRPEIPEEEML